MVTGVFTCINIQAQALTDDQKIAQITGSALNNASPEQIAWMHNCLGRCTVLPEALPLSDSVKQLYTVGTIAKFTSNVNEAGSYNEATFNPLKYMIDFFSNKNQYFVIDGNHTLRVNKKN